MLTFWKGVARRQGVKDGSCGRTRTGGSSRCVEGFCGRVLRSLVCVPSVICQILMITEVDVWREGTEEADGGAMFEIATQKVPGANPVHLTFGRIPVQSH